MRAMLRHTRLSPSTMLFLAICCLVLLVNLPSLFTGLLGSASSSSLRIHPSGICSHQGRLSATPKHGPVSQATLFSSIARLFSKGVQCFDLDLSPLEGGGSAVAHPVALAAAGGAAAEPADFGALFDFLDTPLLARSARLTLELKKPLFESARVIEALFAAAQKAHMLSRLVVLGIPRGTPVPTGLHIGLPIRDDQDCSLEGLSASVCTVMPSRVCWERAAVKEKIVAWARALAPGASATNALAGEVHVWPIDSPWQAKELLAEGSALGLRLKVVSNDVPGLLGGESLD